MDAEAFGKFFNDYQCTAYDALEGAKTMSQGELKRKWKTRMLQAHPDKGGSYTEAQKVNAAWDILKDPDKRVAYDSFLEEFPTADVDAQETGQARCASGEEENPELSPQELLARLGFHGLEPREVDELLGEVEKMRDRATWSYFGFWFRGTVPITDTMHPIGFLVYFMSSDVAQTIAVMAVLLHYGWWTYNYLLVIPLVELLLTTCIAVYILREHVYKQSETWNVNYVLRTRRRYWLLRVLFAVALLSAGTTVWVMNVTKRINPNHPNLLVFWCVGFFQLCLAISQWLAYRQAMQDGRVIERVAGPTQYVEERRTNLLLYYDSWLNSLLVRLPTGTLGVFTMPIILLASLWCVWPALLLHLGLACLLCKCCYSDLEDEHAHVSESCGVITCVQRKTSSVAYSFANWRLRVMQKAWEEGDGRACERELAAWELRNFERALARAVRRWVRRREASQAKEAKEERAKDKDSEGDDEAKEKEEGEGEGEDEDRNETQAKGQGPWPANQPLGPEMMLAVSWHEEAPAEATEDADTELGLPLPPRGSPLVEGSSQKCPCCL